MRLTRRGVALAEALLAALLTSFLVVGALTAFAGLQRALGRQLARAAEARSLRATAQLTAAEWRDLVSPAGDLYQLAGDRISYRGIRGSGRVCGQSAGGLLLESRSLRLLRLPAAGRDSLLVLVSPDAWVAVSVDAASGASTCPDGAPALAVGVAGWAGPVPAWPAAFLLFEAMELRAYQSGGEWWIGQRSISAGETIQPAIGPIAPNGLRITGLDNADMATADPARAEALEVVVQLVRGDSLVRVFPVGAWRP